MPSNFQAVVTHKPDAIHLHAYPALVYAPQQHGDFIAFAHNGKPVSDLVESSGGVTAALDEIAAKHGISFADACDALKYLRDNKAI